jgi:hypothetical protein
VQAAVLAPWLPDQFLDLDRADLQRRVGHPLDDEQLDYLAATGALDRVADGRFRTSPALLGHALALMALPVAQAVLQESAAIVNEHATAVADGLTELFARAVWGPYQRGELTHEQVVAILERMRPMALQGLLGAFARAADDAAHRRLEN